MNAPGAPTGWDASSRLAPVPALQAVAALARQVRETRQTGAPDGHVIPGRVTLDDDGHPVLGAPTSRATPPAHLFGPPRDEAAGGPADAYQLGVVLYRMIAGRFPFDGTNPVESALAHGRGGATPLSAIAPDSPASLDALVEHLLAPAAERRPSSAAAVAKLLDEAADRVACSEVRSGTSLRRSSVADLVPDRSAEGRRAGAPANRLGWAAAIAVVAGVMATAGALIEPGAPNETARARAIAVDPLDSPAEPSPVATPAPPAAEVAPETHEPPTAPPTSEAPPVPVRKPKPVAAAEPKPSPPAPARPVARHAARRVVADEVVRPAAVASAPDLLTADADRLMREGDRLLARKRFLVPKDHNALALYRQVLVLDPTRRAAHDRIELIRASYQQLVDARIAARDLDAAHDLLSALARAMPEDLTTAARLAALEVEMTASRRTGVVALSVTPWGNVFVDGHLVGQTPMDPIELEAGPHRLEVRGAGGSSRSLDLEVVGGRAIDVAVDLTAGEPS